MNPLLEELYLHAVLVGSFLSFSLGALAVIDRFCAFLNINCLTIKLRH